MSERVAELGSTHNTSRWKVGSEQRGGKKHFRDRDNTRWTLHDGVPCALFLPPISGTWGTWGTTNEHVLGPRRRIGGFTSTRSASRSKGYKRTHLKNHPKARAGNVFDFARK